MTAPRPPALNVYAESAVASRGVAERIVELIRAQNGRAVLGLATGSTPTGVYENLVALHRAGAVSFANVVTFNLDEYYPMRPDARQSYHRFMHEHLFRHIDIKPGNIHIPDGTATDAAAHCAAYEKAIADAGGIDLQLLGIGRTGHIGFNEPGSPLDSKTRLITLDRVTRLDAASDFFGHEHVPRRALTMGVGTILSAKQIVILAFGEHKARVVAQAIEGPETPHVPATYLRRHANVHYVLDESAAAGLKAYATPWLTGPVNWDEPAVRRAVIWLAHTVQKPILKLTDEHYNEHGLQDLIASRGSAYEINIEVFRHLQSTITGWPGGKPETRRRATDERRADHGMFPKRVVVFSPHPDDDVISMGGTLSRLCDQGHEVHVAYQTSGNIAVFDHDAARFADFAVEFDKLFNVDPERAARLDERVDALIRNKKPGDVDSPEVRQIKGLIRRGEARAGAADCGVPAGRCHFLDLPFYETGDVIKKPLGDDDVRRVVELLRSLRPHQIYAAGDLSDPHGTHRVCLKAILLALEETKADDWQRDCVVWLYRGAWQEWEPEKIEMAVPLSPSELLRKRQAIFKHQSQKDRAMYPGADEREFWERAEQRNRETARLYDALGLAEYEAIEGFVRWKG